MQNGLGSSQVGGQAEPQVLYSMPIAVHSSSGVLVASTGHLSGLTQRRPFLTIPLGQKQPEYETVISYIMCHHVTSVILSSNNL